MILLKKEMRMIGLESYQISVFSTFFYFIIESKNA